MWSEEYTAFQSFSWIDLRKIPEWLNVKASFQILDNETDFDMNAQSLSVFEQFGYVKKYCTNEKLIEWKANKTTTEDRWVEIFKHFECNQVPFSPFSSIVEYVLCFPGSSASVERLFAHAKKLWKPESTALNIQTLRAMLFVKFNMEYTCTEFHRYLQTHPDTVRKISSQEKYNFKQGISNKNVSPGGMSVDFDSE